MKIRFYIIVSVLFYIPALVFAQQAMDFTEAKVKGDIKTVYFHIEGLNEDKSERAVLLEYLLDDENIINGRIFTSSEYKTRCQLFLSSNITPEYVRAILNTYGYDFDFSAISVDGKLNNQTKSETLVSPFQTPDEGFPTMVYTGDKDKDYEQYRLLKEQWILENQKKHNKQVSNGTAQYPIVVSSSDFDRFTDEKKEKLLAEPDKYVIK